ncbi:hypothetical protein BH10CYA1_BH10CYA1_64540 [soil metagenome]
MKFYHILLGILPGGLVGLVLAWPFVFSVLVPWLGVSSSWANIVGLLLYLCFFAEVGIAVGAVCGIILISLFAILLGQASHIDLRNNVTSFVRKVRRLLARIFRFGK